MEVEARSGGAVVTLCDASGPRGGSWGEDGVIVFQPNSEPGVSLQHVSASGGASEKLVDLVQGEAIQRWPQVLPGAKAVLFTSASSQAGGFDNCLDVVERLPDLRVDRVRQSRVAIACALPGDVQEIADHDPRTVGADGLRAWRRDDSFRHVTRRLRWRRVC